MASAGCSERSLKASESQARAEVARSESQWLLGDGGAGPAELEGCVAPPWERCKPRRREDEAGIKQEWN